MTDFEEMTEPTREFLRRSLSGDKREALLAGHAYDPALLRDMAREGWFGLAAPTAIGGLDLQLAYLGPIARVVGEHLAPGPVVENLLLPSLLAPLAGASALAVLDETVSNGAPIAFVDAMGPQTWSEGSARPRLTDGAITGTGQLVRFGAHASSFVVVCPDSGGDQRVALVDANDPGVTTLHQESADPLSCLAEVRFTDVEPVEVFEEGSAAAVLGDRLRAWLRVLCACELSGASRSALQLAVAHVKQREQFGRPLAAFQAVQHIAADMYTLSMSLDNLLRGTLDDLDEGTAAFALAGASTLAWSGEVARTVCEDSVQLHGGIGFTQDLELHWHYKHVLYAAAWLGDRVELESEIGRRLLDLQTPGNDFAVPQAAGR